ncbi:hypothetical protein VCRA2126O85_10397 [Vibrio crassostreae]|nr:hypothetical protein VCRA2128O100_10397 [Vibrio crassostreae]CAK2728722.1 hypothetical protein VCRA2128O106_10397 [Vibrio crassostreae]CAK2728937.1 hypothetical protein VCRA2125O83_10397 [Vibrio crassostreae]CAK2732351.1 hypothetical protein VCRA2126O86_10398 [Vibrio crassostreae]CAK2736096.1 hypothetical protein VCRA2126O85_10397 [Vibrio crassostreae]
MDTANKNAAEIIFPIPTSLCINSYELVLDNR